MSARYDILEHTADIGVIGKGDDLQYALEGCMAGLFSILYEISYVREGGRTKCIVVEDQGDDTLTAVAGMQEFLVLFYSEMFLASRAEVQRGDDGGLVINLYGEEFDPARHELLTEVKAVTYHMLKTWKEGDTTFLRMLFDV